MMRPPLKKRYIYMVIPIKSHNSKKKLRDFNLGMRKMLIDGTYTKIIDKYELSDQF